MIVHQVLSGAGPFDAVTTQALRWREHFAAWGWQGRDVAVHIDPRMDGAIRPLKELHAQPDDRILLHYSAYAPKLRQVLELPNRTLLLSHNVTPAEWFWDHEPQIAIQCALGRRQLPEYAAKATRAAGVSAYNAGELGSDLVIPILFDPTRLGAPGPRAPAAPPTVLCVGRIAPHKRQDELLRVAAAHGPGLRLDIVGEPLNPRYDERLRTLGTELGVDVVWERSLSGDALADRFRCADAFVTLSEHEGFCVPLLEAFHMGVPVIARPSGGVPEVAGDAALLVEDRDPAVVAELIRLLTTDDELRTTLVERGRARLAAFAPEETARRMRAALEGL